MSELEIIREIICKEIRNEIIGLTLMEKVLILDALKNDIYRIRKQYEDEILKLK